MNDYEGPERRRERVPLSDALDEVRGLRGAVEKLATAVEESPSKEDLVLSAGRLRQALVWLGGMLVAFIVIIVLILTYQHGNLEGNNNDSHDTILCVLKIPIEARTDTSLLTCKAGLR